MEQPLIESFTLASIIQCLRQHFGVRYLNYLILAPWPLTSNLMLVRNSCEQVSWIYLQVNTMTFNVFYLTIRSTF